MMFVNGIPLLVTLSRAIRRYTCEHVPDQKAPQLSASLKKIVNLYARGGFTVFTIMTYMEFENVKYQPGMEFVDVNTTAAQEHMAEIKRGIRFLHRACCTVSTLSAMGIWYLPKQVVIRMVYNITTCVNAVLDKLGVSDKYSPCEIVTHRKFDFEQDCKVQFGVYVQDSDNVLVTTTMKLRTHGCIALGTFDNYQGSTLCFDLKIAKVVTRCIVTELPIPDRMVKRCSTLGKSKLGIKYLDRVEFLHRKK